MNQPYDLDTDISGKASDMLLDALDAMKDSLKSDRPEKCVDCYAGLSKVIGETASRPEDAEYMLKKWVHEIRVKQAMLSCMDCRLPVWD